MANAGHPEFFFVYVTVGAVITFLTILTLRETAHEELR